MHKSLLLLATCCALLASCGNPPIKPSESHIREEPAARRPDIPQPVTRAVPLAPPKPAQKLETYSVVVSNVPAQQLLFALARDAKLNVDIHAGVQGNVTLNAIDQTLPQILGRISKQLDMRYEIDGQTLVVMPDTPYLHHYKVDYVNMTRDSQSTVSIATQIATAGAGGTVGTAAGAGAGGVNNSVTSVSSVQRNRFWETLIQNVKDILRETDKILPEGTADVVTESVQQNSAPGGTPRPGTSQGSPEGMSSVTTSRRVTYREAASVIANPETGVITIRATSRQHEKIQEFLDRVMVSAKRQVLIEATVVEVSLLNQYEQGIDWNLLQNLAGGIFTFITPLGNRPANQNITTGLVQIGYAGSGGSVTIRLLESFGKVKVISSPKISVLNNQTALLKVVDNRVYFTIEATSSSTTTGGQIIPGTVTATPHTVSVGFVMSVTPQISESDSVVLNVRPTLSRITGFVTDPTPSLAVVGVQSLIPEIQQREMESVIKIASGQIAVMGGLMQDEVNNVNDRVPGISSIPLLGQLFTDRNETSKKTELVIFLRPIVIKDASIEGDYRPMRNQLPDDAFFDRPPMGRPFPGVDPSQIIPK